LYFTFVNEEIEVLASSSFSQAFRKKVHASRSQGWCMILEKKGINNMIAARDKNVGNGIPSPLKDEKFLCNLQ
jgi:hypothetical protein